jgi:hypothetical protein
VKVLNQNPGEQQFVNHFTAYHQSYQPHHIQMNCNQHYNSHQLQHQQQQQQQHSHLYNNTMDYTNQHFASRTKDNFNELHKFIKNEVFHLTTNNENSAV